MNGCRYHLGAESRKKKRLVTDVLPRLEPRSGPVLSTVCWARLWSMDEEDRRVDRWLQTGSPSFHICEFLSAIAPEHCVFAICTSIKARGAFTFIDVVVTWKFEVLYLLTHSLRK